MATRAALIGELHEIIQAMEQEGIVDHRFKYVYSMKEVNGPFFFVELILTYSSDARASLRQLTENLEKPVVDFHELDEICLKFKGGTSCLGACRVSQACSQFRRAIDEKSRELCKLGLNLIKQEFYALQDNMDAIIELERRIISHETADP